MSVPQLKREGAQATQPPLAADARDRDHDNRARPEHGLVWIVDDSPLEAEMARRALSGRYAIEIFNDGVAVLERLAGGPGPDTLVLDWQLPGMDGIDVCRFLRGNSDEVALPVVMLTVHGHQQDIVEGLAAGANDYVTKPYDPAELLARVNTLVRTRKLHDRARRAERALEIERDRLLQSERELRLVSEAIPQIVWTADPAGAIEHFNRRWSEYTDLPLQSPLMPAWRSVLHPEDQERVVQRWEAAVRTGAVFDIQYRIRRADGVYHWFLGRALPLREQGGRIVKWFGTLTDIDDHKRAERALDLLARAGAALVASLDSRAASESTAQLAVPALADWCGVYLRDSDDVVTRVAAARAAGVPEVDLLRDLAAERVPPARSGPPSTLWMGEPELVPDVDDALARAVGGTAARLEALRAASVKSWMMVPLAVQRRTFGWLALAITGSARRYDEVDLSLALELGRRTGTAIDNARLFEMTQRERARVEEANHAKDDFLATVSHELRTPLNSILGWTIMLRTEPMSEERRSRAIETIERNARSQTRLIEDLLDISRIISGNLRLNVGQVRLTEVVEAAIETIRPAAEAKDIRLQPDLARDVGSLQGDAERLQQVVWNLLANAVKFTPKGGRVEVRLGCDGDGDDVEIVVADTGRGILPGFLPHVFERFRQADTGIARTHGGLGLGLGITRHLVELHGGVIEARSPGEGLGATFTVRIPLAAALPGAAAPPYEGGSDEVGGDDGRTAPPPPPAPDALAALVGRHVLVVEDEQDARALLVTVLGRCGARVTATASVAEALEAMRRALPDLLVSDIGMPGESGYDLIRTIRLLPPDQGGRIPAVALTAYARMEDRARALATGFDLHMTKPIEPSVLLVALARLVEALPKP